MRDVNLLAVDTRTSASHWLFHGYDRMILTEDAVYELAPADTNRSSPTIISANGTGRGAQLAIALVLQTVDADTNKDGKLSAKDEHSLYVYRAGASEVVKIIAADDFLSTQQIGLDKYLVVYENGKTATAASYSLPDFKLLSEKPLPNVPKS